VDALSRFYYIDNNPNNIENTMSANPEEDRSEIVVSEINFYWY